MSAEFNKTGALIRQEMSQDLKNILEFLSFSKMMVFIIAKLSSVALTYC